MKYSCFYLRLTYLCVHVCVLICVCVCMHMCVQVIISVHVHMEIKGEHLVSCSICFILQTFSNFLGWTVYTDSSVWKQRCWGFELAEPSPQPTVAVSLSFCLFVFIWKCTYMLPIACSLPKQAVGHIKLVSARLPIPSVSHLACHFLPVQPVSLYLLHFRELTSDNK